MSTYQIQIDDNAIMEQITNILNTILNGQIKNKCSVTGDVIACAVKDLIYWEEITEAEYEAEQEKIFALGTAIKAEFFD